MDDMVDDSALDNALSDAGNNDTLDDDLDLDDNDDLNLNLAEQLSRYDTAPPSDVPQREGLYSTPLSWERPQAGLRGVDPLLGLQTTAPGQLTPQEQARLISIALGTGSMTGGLGGGGLGGGPVGTSSTVPTLGAASFAAAFPYAAANPYSGVFGGSSAPSFGNPSYASGSSAYGMVAPSAPAPSQMMNFRAQSQQHSPPQQPPLPSLEDLLEQTRPRPLPPEQRSSTASSSRKQSYIKPEREEEMAAGGGSRRSATEPEKERETGTPGSTQNKGKSKEETASTAAASTAAGTGTGTAGGGPRADRAAHNDIERKYRTNLKDRIAELRDAVPSLRTIREGEALDDDDDDGTGKGGGPKVSKVGLASTMHTGFERVSGSAADTITQGTILTKAVEYIHQLERRNRTILREHQELARRLQAFEQLFAATARPAAFVMPNYSRTLFDPRAFC
jgi:hypothetical protein